MNSVSARSDLSRSFQKWSPVGVLAGGIFIIDLLIPLGVATGVLYTTAILLSLRHQDSQLPLWTAIGCSILTVMAFFMSPAGGELWKVLGNRGLAVFAIWTTALLGRIQLQQTETNQHNLLLTDRVFMTSNDHISILGKDYRYRRVNPSYEETHRKDSPEIVGMSVSDLLGKEIFKQTVKPNLDKCLQGEEIHYEAWFRFADDQDHFMSVSYLPLISESNDIEEIMVTARDLTDRKQDEETLRRQALMFNTVYDGILVTDLNGNITGWNSGAKQMFGYTKEETLGRTSAMFHQPSESATLTKEIIDELTQKGRWQGEINFLRKDGTSGVCETIVAPFMDPDGKPFGTIGVNRDITEKKHTMDALLKSEDQFRDLYESAPLAYFSVSFDGQITRINGRASELLGYTQEEFIGEPVLMLYAPTKDGIQKAEVIQKKAQEGVSIQDEELQMAKKDGTVLWVSLTVRLMYDESGKIIERRGMVQDISAHKRIENELRASEYRFRSLVETAGSIIIELTPDSWIVEWNREAERLYGKTREEVLDQNYLELFIPKSYQANIKADMERVLTGKPTRDFQNPVIDSAGRERQIIWNVDRLLDPDNKPYGIICVGRDVTEWNSAQTQLQKWATIFQHTQWGVAVGHATSPTLEMVNEAYARMHGYTVEELQGKPIAQVFAPESQDELPQNIRLIHEQGFHSFEALHVRKDGSMFPTFLTVSAIKDSNGEVLYRVANVIDISDIKQAEEALHKSEIRFRTYFETGLVGMAITSPQKRWVEVNDCLCSMLEYTREELVGQSWVDHTHPEDLNASEENFDRLMKGEIETVFMEKRYIRRDGTVLYGKLNTHLVRDSSGQKTYLATMIQDISAQKQAEEAIRLHQAELEATVQQRAQRIQELEQRRMQVEKLAALSQIAAGVAHEINNPLASISQSLILLKRAIPTEHPHFRYMAKVEDCIERISKITTHLYQLYRPSSPTQLQVDLRAPIQNAVEIMQSSALKHGVEITAEKSPFPLWATGSRNEIIQVLCNLLQNAIDASQPHDVAKIEVTHEEAQMMIHVIDHGHGIGPEVATRIFEPFFSTKQGHAKSGLGLGLSISHSLIEAMGGTLDFATSLEQGSRFTITLPVTRTEEG